MAHNNLTNVARHVRLVSLGLSQRWDEKLHGKVFERFIRNARTYRYNIMCSIDAHEKENPLPFNDVRSGGGYPLP